MLLNEIWPDDDLIDLTEAGIKDRLGKFAMAGALGAGLLGGGYGVGKLIGGAGNAPQPAAISSNPSVSSPETPDPTANRPSTQTAAFGGNQVRAGGDPHAGYPSALHSQSSAQRLDRIRNFTNSLRPLMQHANSVILADRNKLIRISALGNRATNNDRAWLTHQMQRYDVEQIGANGQRRPMSELIRDLLMRIDIIPDDLAMAQAALETGWGTSDLARQGNNLFGQKATGRHQDAQKIRNVDGLDYRSYTNPSLSIQSYTHNLNTHPRYADFRQARAQLRRQQGMNPQLMARELSKHLQAYSTSPTYMADLNRVMNTLRGI
jgi:uncharacterized FlgJ-related protein